MFRAFPLALAALALGAGVARAADVTDVASSFDEGNKFDFRFRMRYDHTEKRAQIKREFEGLPGQETAPLFKDLAYSSHRDSVTLRAEVGLYHDLMLHAELPIIIEEAASYGYDQGLGSGCVYPPQANPNCVNESNSTTIADGILPAGGFDASNHGARVGGAGLFRSVLRGARGGGGLDAFDTFNLGLTWAPLSQARDDTKPTWVVTVEAQLSIGNIKKFDRGMLDANHAVSDGTHRLRIQTALSKRYRYFEPYWGLWYLLPIARGDSLFVDYGRTQKTKNPAMQAGTLLGVEVVPLDRPAKQYKLGLDLRTRVEGHFNGRGYSELWEVLASSSALACDNATGQFNPACGDAAPQSAYKNQAFTGLTTIENYATVGADIAVQAQIGPYIRFRTGFEYSHDQSHYITGDDIGTPSNPTGRVTQPSEFNPAYRPIIDLIGRRYLVDNINTFNFYLWAQLMF